ESGERIVVPAWLEPQRGFGPTGVTATFDGTRVHGLKRPWPVAAAADRLVVLTREGFVLVDPKAQGVTLTQQKSISSDTQYRATLDGAASDVVTADLGTIS